MNRKTLAREGLLVVGLVGGWFVLLPVLAFFFYSPHEGGAIHLAGLLLRDLFVDLRSGVWLLVLASVFIAHLFFLRVGFNVIYIISAQSLNGLLVSSNGSLNFIFNHFFVFLADHCKKFAVALSNFLIGDE